MRFGFLLRVRLLSNALKWSGFTTLESKEAAWVDPVTNTVHRIRTKDGVCVAPNFIGASLS